MQKGYEPMKRTVQFRRIAGLLLAAMMALLIPISASAAENEPALEWTKTTVSYKIPDGFIAFIESKLGEELAKLGITMPSIDWNLVAYAGDIDPETQYVTADEQLMCTLALRYIKRAADMPENRAGFNALTGPLVGDALGLPVPAFTHGFFAGCFKFVLGLLYR